MMRSLAPDRERATLAILATIIVLAFPSAGGQVSAIVFGGAAGFVLFRSAAPTAHGALSNAVSKSAAIVALALFFMMLRPNGEPP
jgi:chromate transporter